MLGFSPDEIKQLKNIEVTFADGEASSNMYNEMLKASVNSNKKSKQKPKDKSK